MKNRAAAFPPSTLLVLLLLLLSPPRAQSSDLIDKICKTTPFFDLCEASLRPLAQSNPADPKSLATAATTVVLGNMTETLGYIEGLIRHSRDPASERALAKCAELYRPAVRYNIPQAIDAMRRGEFGFAEYVLGDAEKQVDTCNKWISGGGLPELTQRNAVVKNLCDVAIAVMKLLTKGG